MEAADNPITYGRTIYHEIKNTKTNELKLFNCTLQITSQLGKPNGCFVQQSKLRMLTVIMLWDVHRHYLWILIMLVMPASLLDNEQKVSMFRRRREHCLIVVLKSCSWLIEPGKRIWRPLLVKMFEWLLVSTVQPCNMPWSSRNNRFATTIVPRTSLIKKHWLASEIRPFVWSCLKSNSQRR